MTVESSAVFRFDPKLHEYWLGGLRLPSVTQVLSGIGIIDAEYFTEAARQRGKAVHIACALFDQGRLDWSSLKATEEWLEQPIEPYVRAWEKFRSETKCEIIDIEQIRYHPRLLFAGTRDRRLKWGKSTYLIDIKTIGTPGAQGPRWAAEQTAGYQLLEPGDKANPDKRASIVLYPDGSFHTEIHNDFNDASFFLSYLTTYRRLIFHGRIKND